MRLFRITLCMIVLLSLFAFLGCGEEDSSPVAPSPLPSEFVGTWVYQSVTVNGTQVPLDNALEWQPTTVSAAMTFDSDNNYTYEERDSSGGVSWTESGSVSVSGQTFSLRVTKQNGVPIQPDITIGTVVVNSNQMTATVQDGANTIVSSLTKQ
jgi:hypothetical protein